MKNSLVYRLLDNISLEDGSAYSKGDIVSYETMERFLMEYYEVNCVIIRIQ